MNQDVIVYIILALTIGSILYFSIRKKKPKKAVAGSDNCRSDGCSGCPLKDCCH